VLEYENLALAAKLAARVGAGRLGGHGRPRMGLLRFLYPFGSRVPDVVLTLAGRTYGIHFSDRSLVLAI
jgi:hypothetical protein